MSNLLPLASITHLASFNLSILMWFSLQVFNPIILTLAPVSGRNVSICFPCLLGFEEIVPYKVFISSFPLLAAFTHCTASKMSASFHSTFLILNLAESEDLTFMAVSLELSSSSSSDSSSDSV